MRLRILSAALACLFLIPSANGHDGEGDHKHGDHQDGAQAVMTTRSTAKRLAPPVPKDGFQFIVYGDRTGGVPAGLKVLEQAVVDTNLLDPDLVMTVGDLIQGYNETPQWLEQADEFKAIMKRLSMKWYPVAGNHDIYYRGKKPVPPGHHEANYETHFGPLWYSFKHKNAGFVVLYSDEGDPQTNKKTFSVGALQNMSKEQLAFLDQALKDLADQDHVFVFLHHPRWIGGSYTGCNWDEVHTRLKDAGNVSAVFAGHIHRMRYEGPIDGIEYYALATTGGSLPNDTQVPGVGSLHHFNIVTVRPETISVATLPVGEVMDPKQFTPEFLRMVDQARGLRWQQTTPNVMVDTDGETQGEVTMKLTNTTNLKLQWTGSFDDNALRSGWRSSLDHQHGLLEPGETAELSFLVQYESGPESSKAWPKVNLETRVFTKSAAVDLPMIATPLKLKLSPSAQPQADPKTNQALVINGPSTAVQIDSNLINIAPESPLTLEAWFKPTAANDAVGAIAKTESSEYAFFFNDNKIQFDINIEGRYISPKAPLPLPLNKWSHVAGVFDGQQAMLFINGKQVAAVPAKGRRKTNTLPLYLGADPNRSGQPSRPFTGLIDEIRLSNVARYQGDFEPAERFQRDKNSVLLHHCDQSAGPFLLDDSGNGAHGKLGSASQLQPR